MKRRALMLLTIAIGALLQQVLPSYAICGGMKPPVLAALTVHYALRRNNKDMWLVVFVAALMQDGLDLGPFGPALVAFPIIGLFANRVRYEVFADGLVSQLFFGAVLGLFTTFVALLIYTLTDQRPFQFGLSTWRLFSAMLLGMATLPLVSLVINKIEEAIPKRRGYGWQ